MYAKDTMTIFEESALPHTRELLGTARRLVGSAQEAEDLVQETLLQAWKSFSRFQPGTNCRAWLFKILVNVVHHHRRKWFNTTWIWRDDEFLKETLASKPAPFEALTDEEVIAAVNQLPAHYRETVLLADIQEYSYKEIAQILEIPIGTVMSRLNRGRGLLRSSLSPVAEEFGIPTTKPAKASA